jgi:hypothetical protein
MDISFRWAGMGLLLAAVAPFGCAHDARRDGPGARPAAGQTAVSSAASGEQLWAQTCARCHHARSAKQYSDQQWQIIVHHMRLRADLTGQEQRQITRFLQSGE